MELYKEIFLSKAGTLARNITEREKENVTHLKISGYINSKDFDVLDDMCTSWGEFDEDDNYIMDENEPPFLKVLDLGDCIMEGKAVLGEFTYYSKLEEVILPKNLENTSNDFEGTFQESVLLTKVVFPDTLKEIGHGTFICCEKLDNVNLPEKLETIGGLAFSGCKSLKSIIIPANLFEIGGSAFQHCESLEKFEIDEQNTHFTVIDGVLFSKDKTKLISFPCGNKNQNYIVPNGVKIICDGAFAGSKIRNITFPSSLEVIEGWAFRGCDYLETLYIPDSVIEIGELAFEFCDNIKNVRLSNNLKVLSGQVFGGCNNLKELEVPASVKKIEGTALAWAYNLENLILCDGLEEINDDLKYKKKKKLHIPKTVKKIKSGLAILGHSELSKIEYEVAEENPFFCAIDGSLYSKDKTRLVAVKKKKKEQFVVPNGVQIIEQFVFQELDFEQIFLPDTLTTIEYRCFENCKKIREITLPKSLKFLDFCAFDECENLEKITILATIPPELIQPSADCWKFLGYAKKATLYVPIESLETYRKTARWNEVKRIEPIQ
jgi:hypothetical protein